MRKRKRRLKMGRLILPVLMPLLAVFLSGCAELLPKLPEETPQEEAVPVPTIPNAVRGLTRTYTLDGLTVQAVVGHEEDHYTITVTCSGSTAFDLRFYNIMIPGHVVANETTFPYVPGEISTKVIAIDDREVARYGVSVIDRILFRLEATNKETGVVQNTEADFAPFGEADKEREEVLPGAVTEEGVQVQISSMSHVMGEDSCSGILRMLNDTDDWKMVGITADESAGRSSVQNFLIAPHAGYEQTILMGSYSAFQDVAAERMVGVVICAYPSGELQGMGQLRLYGFGEQSDVYADYIASQRGKWVSIQSPTASGARRGLLLVADEVYIYDRKYNGTTAARVYIQSGGETKYLGDLRSEDRQYPLVVGDAGFYIAGENRYTLYTWDANRGVFVMQLHAAEESGDFDTKHYAYISDDPTQDVGFDSGEKYQALKEGYENGHMIIFRQAE